MSEPMSKYGAMAQRHWRTRLAGRYAAIEDPASFFAELGQEVSDRIAALELDLRGPERPEAEFLSRVGANNMARLRAEEIVLQEMVLLPAENSADGEDSDEMPPEWRIPTAQETAAAVIASEERAAH
ncbi:hypothetical protein M6B22_07055 [Jatrophihabitans cynanchi]|uniref:TnpV protein n=1 Tax=Jatrophihabitans cynanchi TaxID=2944128 RepID=A0ABY7K3D9_9ACTN|nr:hypothetical protein [Jatrophihabitans sp. SB3-54]WAX58515.1 hypothetical protein M6B22_07055 [Jatrophihabitans sp. SB3-54]